MIEVHNRAFYSTALHYQKFEAILRDTTNASLPITVREVLDLVEGATYQQVASCVAYLKKKGLVGMIREGQEGKYWWKANDPKPTPVITPVDQDKQEPQTDKCPNVEVAQPVKVTATVIDASDKPEITVTKTSIIVSSKTFKLTVEL